VSKVANDIDGRLTNFWYAPEVGIVMIDRIRLAGDPPLPPGGAMVHW
jgi:hypothetical protein